MKKLVLVTTDLNVSYGEIWDPQTIQMKISSENEIYWSCDRSQFWGDVQFKPLLPKEGKVQILWDGSTFQPITLLTLGGVSKVIPAPFNNSYNPTHYGKGFLSAIELIAESTRTIMYEERNPTERQLLYFDLVSFPLKKGKMIVNGISISYETPNGMTVYGEWNGMLISGEIWRRWNPGEWDSIIEKIALINKLRHSHPRAGFKTQYFKKGMIGVTIPDGSIIWESRILTPSNNIYLFESSGSGRSFGYYCYKDRIASEADLVKFYQNGNPVKGSSVIDKIFGVTNKAPQVIE